MKKIYKVSIYIVSAIIILLVVFNLLFSSVLRWQVDNLSNGKVHLRSEKASGNIFSESILFTDVLIEFDSMSVDAASKIYLRNLKFSSLKINHISIFQLLFKRNFSVEKIEFSDPELNFMRDTVISRQDLFTKVITPEVVKSKSQEASFSFEIGEIVINQGAMHFRGRQGEEVDLEKINISIKDVRLSDLSQMEVTKKDLSAHFKLNVNLYDVRKRFKDEYTFSIDSFSYYSGIKYLLVSGISLTPDSLDNFEDQPEINFRTEFLKINGFDLNEFVMNQNLEFEKVQISNGDFWESKDYYFLNSEDEPDTTKKSSPFGIGFLNSFKTDTFQLQNLNLISLTKKLDTVYRVENGNITILDIHVDSGFVAEYKYIDLAENTYLNSGSLRIQWMKPVFDFHCDTFSFTGNDGREFMKNIRFTHHTYSKDKSKQQLLIDACIDSLEMKGLNIRKILKSDSIHLSMFLQNPIVNIFEWDSLPVKSKKGKKGKFPSTIFLDDFRIQDGSFSFVSDISKVDAKVDKLNLLFDTLKINLKRKGDSDIIDFDAFMLECEGIMYQNSMNPAIANIDHLFIDERNVNLNGLRFSDGDALNTKASGSNSFKSDGFSISDFSIKNLVNKKEFVCGEILIQKPEYYGKASGERTQNEKKKTYISKEIIGEKIAAILNGKINKLKIDILRIDEAYVDYQIARDSLHAHTSLELKMENIRFNPGDPLGDTLFHFPEYFQFRLNNTGFESSKFEIDLDNILYNNLDKELRIVNLSTKTKEASLSDSKFRVDIPLISLKSPYWNPENEQPFSFASINVYSPELYFEIDKKEKNTSSKSKKKFTLPFFVGDSVKILAGTFKMQINKQSDTLDFSTANFNLEWKTVANEYIGEEFNDDLLAGINFDIKDFTLNSEKSNISLDNIYFDKQKNIIELEGIMQLAWKPATDSTERKLKNRISMPNLHIEYPHLYGEAGEPLGLWVSNITGNETNLEFYPTGGKNKKAPRFKISDSSAMKFLESFKYVQIDSIYFPNIHIRVNTDSTKQKPIDFKRISFHMNGLLMDSSLLDPNKTSYAEDIYVHLHDREIVSADSMYKLRTSYLTYYFSKDRIVFDSLEVIPRYDKDLFFEKAKYQTDRMQVATKNVIIDGVDLESLIKTGEYHFNKISINNLKLFDYRDKHYQRMPGQLKPLPQEMLQNIPAIFKVDTIQINNSYILYGEYVDKSDLPGEVYFDDFNATVYNVSNAFKKYDTSFMMTTHIRSKLMGSADLDLTLKVPLMENADYFWFSGEVENIDLTDFNSMTENLFGITIRRGHGSLKIPEITGNSTKSLGELTFLYKKFKLAMYNRKKARLNRGIASPLIDFMMNDVLVKSNNPKFLGKERVGEVYFVRDQEKSIFNFIWKSIMSGTLSTMGFNKKEQREAAKEKKKEMKEERREGEGAKRR